LDLHICPGCGTSLPERHFLKHQGGGSNAPWVRAYRRDYLRGARALAESAVTSSDVISYYGTSVQSVAAGQLEKREKASRARKEPGGANAKWGRRSPRIQGARLRTQRGNTLLEEEETAGDYIDDASSGEQEGGLDKGGFESNASTNNEALDFAAPMQISGEEKKDAGASLWGVKPANPKKAPGLSSRYLRVATYLREQGLVLDRAIHRCVGEESVREVQAVFSVLQELGCEQVQAVSMLQR
jgi:hypothetical protein